MITVLALMVLVGWLMIDNDLWERPVGRRRGDVVLYNSAMLFTVALGSLCMYLVLFVLMLAGAAVVIPASYLLTILGHPVGVQQYALLAWLSSSMGTVAGALGASLESKQSVQQATFSRREQERRATARGQEGRGEGEAA